MIRDNTSKGVLIPDKPTVTSETVGKDGLFLKAIVIR